MAVRTFVALELSAALKDGILSLIGTLKQSGPRASWSRGGTLHLTLKFLGDVDEGALPDVVAAVRRAARGVPAFAFRTGSPGAFPSPRRPRVLWLGVDPCGELLELQRRLEGELERLGFPRERRRFHPHVTLGRLRDARAGSVETLLAGVAAPVETVAVHEVLVMKSTLAPGGAVHEVIEVVPLGERHEGELEEAGGRGSPPGGGSDG